MGATPRKLPSLFSYLELNKDPETRKYMPYDEVAFPSLTCSGSELEAMWMAGHLDHMRRTESKRVAAKMRPFLALPEGAIMPRAGLAYRRIKPEARKQEVSSLSEAERLRLSELASALAPTHRPQNPYLVANRKMRHACARRKPPRVAPSMRCPAIAAMTLASRAEIAAQVVVARAWRRHARRKRLAERVHAERVVVPIQAGARAYIARRLVAAWWSGSQRLAVKWQARLRRAMSARRASTAVGVDHRAAVEAQRRIRGFVGRRRGARRKVDAAATRIQRLYRGAVARCRADLTWLGRVPVRTQARVRGVLARKRVARVRTVKTGAAEAIERCYRGFLARRVRARLLEEREDEALEALLRELAAFAERLGDRGRRLERRRRDLETRAEASRAAISDLVEAVARAETHYVNAKLDLERCTPRSISAGWIHELRRHVADHRKSITTSKLAVLFEGLRPHAYARRALDDHLAIVAWHDHLVARVNDDRQAELKCMWARDSRRRHDRAARDERQRVADEKRAWRVRFFNPDGKPLAKRTEPRAEPEVGGALAEAVAQAETALDAQHWINQVAHFDDLFRPYFEPFAKLSRESATLPTDILENSTAPPPPPDVLKPDEQALVVLSPATPDESRQTASHTVGSHDVDSLKRRSRRRRARQHVDRIPWSLLDELDAEKAKFETRKAVEQAGWTSSEG